MHNSVNTAVIGELKLIAGEDNVIYEDSEQLKKYSYDEAAKNDENLQKMPEAVVKVNSADEVSKILKLANEKNIPITPRGSGSGLAGAAVPVYGGIVISTEKMNRILELDRQNLSATAEPGVITNDLDRAARRNGLFFAGYPMSLENCTIGGNVAHNAGGARAVKYGVTGHYVLGIEVVMPTGEIVTFGGKNFKNVMPYNIIQLMLGSEGTLGFITKIILKLLPIPAARSVLLVAFDELSTALSVVPLILTGMNYIPSAIEFMDRESVDKTYGYLGKKKPHPDCGSLLIIELDDDDRDAVRNKSLEIGELCLEKEALDAFAAETPGEQDEIWKIRRTCPEIIHSSGQYVFSEDICVPLSQIADMAKYTYGLGKKHNLITFMLGHAGDGNIHVFCDKKPEMSSQRWKYAVPAFLNDLYTYAAEIGGTITGEHGIGHKRKNYLPIFMTTDEINTMKKIKKALDPNNIMNPGTKFDI